MPFLWQNPLLITSLFHSYMLPTCFRTQQRYFYFPALLVGGFTLCDLLDKPWLQVSCRAFPPVRAFNLYRASFQQFRWFSPFFLCRQSVFSRAFFCVAHSEDPSVHYPLRMGLARRRWCVCTGRLKSLVAGTGSIFRGCES